MKLLLFSILLPGMLLSMGCEGECADDACDDDDVADDDDASDDDASDDDASDDDASDDDASDDDASDDDASDDDDAAPSGPAIEITPDEVDFGTITLGDQPAQTWTIHSIGDENLVVSSLGIDEGYADFNVEVYQGDLPPGTSQNLLVMALGAAVGEATATVRVMSNDPNLPEATLPLRAEVVEP